MAAWWDKDDLVPTKHPTGTLRRDGRREMPIRYGRFMGVLLVRFTEDKGPILALGKARKDTR